jgi:hypothetical protein
MFGSIQETVQKQNCIVAILTVRDNYTRDWVGRDTGERRGKEDKLGFTYHNLMVIAITSVKDTCRRSPI